ncbi:MAG: tRNA (adenosine(37)-N6)-threonylcarbamoyltransferase complex transferase subunit TsaD [Bacteroidota bacterium]|nr:tRNA (adenosine(37)-N6)-threonylcarbamoyltransferase complex transferase subunit TsaD [Bacteroidota bacterium]
MQKEVLILAIESSCDDTSAAIICNDKILANITATQKIHEQYGGVVPELASRDHQKNIIPVIDAALKKAGVNLSQINGIAFTRGPGLMGSLLVGASVAKSLSLSLDIPLIEVNHMQGHILAHFIKENDLQKIPSFPFLCLTISGGHTQLVKVKDYLDFELLGETTDDAVGEAFDKAAKILGLGYPGGPQIDKLAQQGDYTKFKFAESKVDELNFSFSGIKTSFLYFVQNHTQKNIRFVDENLNDICASYQKHLVSVLMKKLLKAAEQTGIKDVAIAGGVSANSEVRKQIEKAGKENNWNVFIPKLEYCTDNAAMIAVTAYYKYLKNDFCKLDVAPMVRMKI